MKPLNAPSAWATLRFRRAKDVRGWALLGIPAPLYPQVMQRLFEQQARFIEKHYQTFPQGEFINILFEAPAALAATLALNFPAPAGEETLSINETGERLLYGKAAQSAKAQHQAKCHGPNLATLAKQIGFWQAVEANTRTTFSLEAAPNLSSPEEEELKPKTIEGSSERCEAGCEGTDPIEEPLEDLEGWEEDQTRKDKEAAAVKSTNFPADSEETFAEETLTEETFEDIWVEEDSDWQEEPDLEFTQALTSDAARAPIDGDDLGEEQEDENWEENKDPDYNNHPVSPTAVAQALGEMTIEQAMTSSSDRSALIRSRDSFKSVLRGNAEQIDILRQGSAIWNLWRDRHLDIRPSFRGAYLNHLNLQSADLHDADLRFAFLFHTDISGADLRGASLLGADLIHANLEGSDLREASLSGAYLTHANLSHANLAGADLRGTFLYGAAFHQTIMPNGEWSELR